MIKQSIKHLSSSFLLALLLLEGCTTTSGMTTMGTDISLPQVKGVKYLVDKGSVGFEWPMIKDPKIKGIKIYRTISNGQTVQKYTHIGTVSSRYATHYVDRTVQPNRNYKYSFVTYTLLKESLHGDVVSVTTKEAIEPVGFLKLYQSQEGIIKILWSPHSNKDVAEYIVERQISGGRWRFLSRVKGRLMPEYIDSSVVKGYYYSYRVTAVTANGIKSQPSESSVIQVK